MPSSTGFCANIVEDATIRLACSWLVDRQDDRLPGLSLFGITNVTLQVNRNKAVQGHRNPFEVVIGPLLRIR